MINITLFFIGIICIFTTFYFILKDNNKEEELYQKMISIHKEVETTSKEIEDIVDHLEYLIDDFMDTTTPNGSNKKEKDHKESHKPLENKIQDDIKNGPRNAFDEILELKKKGLTSNQIAKSLGKGIREVDIILKMKDDEID